MQARLVRKTGIFFLVLHLVFFSAAGLSEEKNLSMDLAKEIDRFERIDPYLYRGSQPTERGLEMLKKLGVRTIINFRHEKDEIEWERREVEKLGLHYVSLPWRIQWKTDSRVMKEFLDLIKQKEKGPFFMHCRRGVERTGIAEAIYQYYQRGLSFEAAYQKATEDHPVRFYWKPFVRTRYREFAEELGPQQ